MSDEILNPHCLHTTLFKYPSVDAEGNDITVEGYWDSLDQYGRYRLKREHCSRLTRQLNQKMYQNMGIDYTPLPFGFSPCKNTCPPDPNVKIYADEKEVVEFKILMHKPKVISAEQMKEDRE